MKRPFAILAAALAGFLLSHLGRAAEIKPKNNEALKGLKVTAQIKGDSEADGRVALRLSSDLILTLHVEGATVPKEPVQPILATQDWQVLNSIPSKAEPIGPESVRWQQSFVLSPNKPGDLPLPLAPLTVGGQKVDWDPITVKVTTEAKADVNDLRDITPPEDVPSGETANRWWFWPAALLVFLALLLGVCEALRTSD